MNLNLYVSRRSFLIRTGLIAAAGLATTYGFVRSSVKHEVRKRFAQPREILSENGVLNLVLDMKPKFLKFNSGHRWALAYNNNVPGPTLRVKPGDTINVKLYNHTGALSNLHVTRFASISKWRLR